MAINVYLDESGDLGWKFTAPYRKGGSSRFMTIAFIICPSEKKHFLKRVVSKVYTRLEACPKTEIKGSSLSLADKEFVARQTLALLQKNPDIKSSILPLKRKTYNSIYNQILI